MRDGKDAPLTLVAVTVAAATLLGASVLATPTTASGRHPLGEASGATQAQLVHDGSESDGSPGAGVSESALAILPEASR